MAIELSGAVGRGPAINLAIDVTLVQAFFVVYLSHLGSSQIGIAAAWRPGEYDPTLGDVIAWCQRKRRLSRDDGRIDRNGRTWREMVAVVKQTRGLAIPGWIDPPSPPTQEEFVKRTERTTGYLATRQVLPQLFHPSSLSHKWEMDWGATASGGVMDWYYECPRSARCQFIGVAAPSNLIDADAYLIFFHHPIVQEPGFYNSRQSFLDWGIGDYMIGRMQVMRQLALSGRRIAVLVPAPVLRGQTEFTTDEDFVTRALARIDSDILGIESRNFPDLLLAGYSGGLKDLDDFFNNMPNLRKKVRAVFDFDGALVTSQRSISLANWAKAGAQVLRYKGIHSPNLPAGENELAFIGRASVGNPSTVPLHISRWAKHDNIKQAAAMTPMWWLHHYIPTCMLQHALASCRFLS